MLKSRRARVVNESVAISINRMRESSGKMIDETARIDASAKIGANVSIGPWSIIGPDVEIGDNTEIGAHVVISRDTKIGKRNKIHAFAAIGGDPQDLRYQGEDTFLEMGDDNIVREFVTIHRGSSSGVGTTRIGNNNWFLAYSHVAHDCVIGNEVKLINNATLGGHVIVDDYATVGALCAVHQFCRVGSYSFLSHGAMITQDVLPYIIVVGDSAKPCGLNVVGLKRSGFSATTISDLKRAYHIIFLRGLKLKEIKEELGTMAENSPEVNMFLEILNHSKRGFVR
jgi:UDP-N-acetylglucosamine acyltransferase